MKRRSVLLALTAVMMAWWVQGESSENPELEQHLNPPNGVELKKEPDISVKVFIKVGDRAEIQLHKGSCPELAPGCFSEPISFRVEASDVDYPICETRGIPNYLRDTEVKVKVFAGDKRDEQPVQVIADSDLPKLTMGGTPVARIWSGTVDLTDYAESVKGKWARFQLVGLVDDEDCPFHKNSWDQPENMNAYQAKIPYTMVDKIVLSGTSDEGTLYASMNQTLTLEAKPKPADADFQAGKPTWSVSHVPSQGATANLQSSSASETVYDVSAFSHPGEYEVTAGTCNGGDTIKIDALKVSIVRVPPDYYAQSDSWVPFRFKVEGTLLPVKVNSGTIQFIIGGQVQPADRSLVLKPFKPDNGQAVEYLAVADQAMFDASSTRGEQINNACLKLKDVSVTVDNHTVNSMDSGNSSAFIFGDNTIEIVEIGSSKAIQYRESSTRQDQVDRVGDASYWYIGGRHAHIPPGVVPREITRGHDMLWLGFDDWDAKITLDAADPMNKYSHHCRLYDDRDFTGVGGGDVVEARTLDRQSGAYWVAFRNQVRAGAPGNDFGVPVVGVVPFWPSDTVLFTGATAAGELASSESTLGDSLGYGGLVLDAATQIFAASPVGAVLTAAEGIINQLQTMNSLLDPPNEPSERGEAVVFHALGRASVPDGLPKPRVPISFDLDRLGTKTANVAYPDQLVMAVNNTYRGYLSSSLTTRAESRHGWRQVEVEGKLDINLGDGKVTVTWPALPPEQVNVIACE